MKELDLKMRSTLTAKSKEKQYEFPKVGGWGGKRKGAGRPNKSGQVNHMERPRVNLKAPLHVTLRLKRRVPTLRQSDLLDEFKKCIQGAREFGLFVIHFSIQSNHIHMFVEARSNKALAGGMRALAGRFAKLVRAQAAKREGQEKSGSVFVGRYHLRVLKTPMEVKNALEYVLLNLSKHQNLIEDMDNYSSATRFTGWNKLLGRRFTALVRHAWIVWQEKFQENKNIDGLEGVLSPPQSWLAHVGWMKACA